MESDSTQSWLVLSRASEAQELAQEVPKPVASRRKGPGFASSLVTLTGIHTRLYDEPVLLAVLHVSHPLVLPSNLQCPLCHGHRARHM